jgi:hypothetical protein
MKKIEFTIDKNNFEIKELNLQNYKDIMDMLQNSDDETPYEIVEYLSGCPKEELKSLKLSDWFFLWAEVEEQLQGQNTTTSIQPTIEYLGVRYGLPQIEDMSVGEFADLDIIASGTNLEKRLLGIAAIVYRPIIEETEDFIKIEKHTSDGAKKREKLFQHLPLSAVLSASTFFLQSASQSLKNILDSSPKGKNSPTLLQDLEELEKSLQPDHGGPSLTSYLQKIPSDLLKLQNYLYEQPLTGSPGGATR